MTLKDKFDERLIQVEPANFNEDVIFLRIESTTALDDDHAFAVMTAKQARKVAKALKRAAREIEGRLS